VQKIKISAKALLEDIGSGMTDTALMEKYRISLETLDRLFKKLVEKGLLTRADIDERKTVSETIPGPVIGGANAAVISYSKFGPVLVALAGIALLVVNVALVIGVETKSEAGMQTARSAVAVNRSESTATGPASRDKDGTIRTRISAASAGRTAEAKKGALIEAAEKGQWEEVIRLAERGADINARGKNGVTALIRACRYAPLSVTTRLLDKGADPNRANDFGWTPLMESIRWNRPLKTKLLLERGADPHAATKDGTTVLMVASRWSGPATVKLLLDKGAEIDAETKQGRTALMFASSAGMSSNVKMLTARGADVNSEDKLGHTALSLARSNGRKDVVALLKEFRAAEGKYALASRSARNAAGRKLSKEAVARNEKFLQAADENRLKDMERLLDKGANIDARDKNFGMTALMRACWNGYEEQAEFLLAHGADIRVKDKQGRTAIEFASEGGDKKIIALLHAYRSGKRVAQSSNDPKSAGSKKDPELQARRKNLLKEVEGSLKGNSLVNARDRYGFTALTRAAGSGRTEEVKRLIEEGADVDLANKFGTTALLAAVCNGHTEVVKFLMEKGADVNAADNKGRTALIFAAGNNRLKMIELLLQKRAEINAADKEGATALIKAAAHGHQDAVKLLLERGADPSIKDAKGRTAEQAAMEKGHRRITTILMKTRKGR
jgi:ankyrin repeat protein